MRSPAALIYPIFFETRPGEGVPRNPQPVLMLFLAARPAEPALFLYHGTRGIKALQLRNNIY